MCRRWRTNPGRFGSKLWLWGCGPDRSRWSFEEGGDIVLLILGSFPGDKSRDWIRCFVSRRCWLGVAARERPRSWSVDVFEEGFDAAELWAGVAGVVVV